MSKWNQHHIIAFHMLDVNYLPIESMYPVEFYPHLTIPSSLTRTVCLMNE
jgi:hypothetical protein